MTSRIHARRSTGDPSWLFMAGTVVVAGAWAGFRHDAWAGAVARVCPALAGWFFAYPRYVWAKRTEEQYRILFNNSNDGVLCLGWEDGVPPTSSK